MLLSSTATGLQNQINSFEKASSSLGLIVNLEETKVIVFRKGGHIAVTEKWLSNIEIEMVNSYKYLGYTQPNYLLVSLVGSAATKRKEKS